MGAGSLFLVLVAVPSELWSPRHHVIGDSSRRVLIRAAVLTLLGGNHVAFDLGGGAAGGKAPFPGPQGWASAQECVPGV